MSRFYVICFDIADKKRLRQVSIQLENFGNRIQYSVFECHLSTADLTTLKQRIADIIDQEEDHVRYYGMCKKDYTKIFFDGDGALTKENAYLLF
jgi:CRISPR-associated protein Cas2